MDGKFKINWWGIHKNLSNSKEDLIAFFKGTKKEMESILLGVYFGTAGIVKRDPIPLNYKIKIKDNLRGYSIEEEDARRISSYIFRKEKYKIEKSKKKVLFEINMPLNKTSPEKKFIPIASFFNGANAKNYSETLTNPFKIKITKNPKNLEFKIIDEKSNSPIAMFKNKIHAISYNNQFLEGKGRIDL